tara:strand:- start:694 stop:963 length:270 start_codon:yes stop_codon:yes gene_type:complete
MIKITFIFGGALAFPIKMRPGAKTYEKSSPAVFAQVLPFFRVPVPGYVLMSFAQSLSSDISSIFWRFRKSSICLVCTNEGVKMCSLFGT